MAIPKVSTENILDAIRFIDENGISPLRFHHFPRGVIGCY